MKTRKLILLTAVVLLQLLASVSCEPQKEREVKMPHNIISVQKGIMMKDNYKNGVQQIIEKNREYGKYQATEFAWVDLDSLKNYIALLDKVSKLNNKKVTGLRIYFSQYPDADKEYYNKEQIEKLIPGRETIFFAPTMGITGNATTKKYPILENVPFCIKNVKEDRLKGDFEIITGLLGRYEQKIALPQKQRFQQDLETSLLLNEVAMFPPPKQ